MKSGGYVYHMPDLTREQFDMVRYGRIGACVSACLLTARSPGMQDE